MPTYQSEIIYCYISWHTISRCYKAKFYIARKLKRERRSKKRNKIPTKTPLVLSQESKKGHAEKDVKSKWAAKASCC